MSDAAAQRAQGLQSLTGPRFLLIAGQPQGHLIHGGGQIADFIVAGGLAHGREVALGDALDLRPQVGDRPCDAGCDDERRRGDQHRGCSTDRQRRPSGLPAGLAPDLLRVEDVQRLSLSAQGPAVECGDVIR